MSLSKIDILRNLDPYDPASIAALINFHRSAFGAARMTAAPPEKAGDSGAKPDTKPDEKAGANGTDTDQKALGESGLKALQAERDARKALEKQLQDFQAERKAQAAKLAEAFGLAPKDAGSTTDDVVATLQRQVQEMQRSTLVYQVAAEHRITDKDDLELIKSASTEDAMRKLATRLAAKPADSGDATSTGRPKADHSVGATGTKVSGREAGLAEARKRFPQAQKQ